MDLPHGMTYSDPSYGTAHDDPFVTQDPAELERHRIERSMALDRATAYPDRFRFIREDITPEPQSPVFGYAPGVGESEYPTVMGRHAEAFAEELGIPFEQEDHRVRSLGPREHMSTLNPTGTAPFQPGAVNEEPSLYGAFGADNLSQQPSLLTEPVSVNPAVYGGGHEEWPEGAVDYVSQSWGRSELDVDYDSFRWIDNKDLTDQYMQDREDFLDREAYLHSLGDSVSLTSGSWASYDPDEDWPPLDL